MPGGPFASTANSEDTKRSHLPLAAEAKVREEVTEAKVRVVARVPWRCEAALRVSLTSAKPMPEKKRRTEGIVLNSSSRSRLKVRRKDNFCRSLSGPPDSKGLDNNAKERQQYFLTTRRSRTWDRS